MDVKAYAASVRRARGTVQNEVCAAEVTAPGERVPDVALWAMTNARTFGASSGVWRRTVRAWLIRFSAYRFEPMPKPSFFCESFFPRPPFSGFGNSIAWAIAFCPAVMLRRSLRSGPPTSICALPTGRRAIAGVAPLGHEGCAAKGAGKGFHPTSPPLLADRAIDRLAALVVAGDMLGPLPPRVADHRPAAPLARLRRFSSGRRPRRPKRPVQ